MLFFFPSKDYSSYPSFPQSQYSQYYSSSYNSPYVSANSISPSAVPASTYSLQESSQHISSQSTESLAGRCISSGFRLAVSATCRRKHSNLALGICCLRWKFKMNSTQKGFKNLWPLFECLTFKVSKLTRFMELLTDYDPPTYCSSTVLRYCFPTNIFVGMQ